MPYYTDEEGIFLVKLARWAIETYLREGKKIKPPKELPSEKLSQQNGVFVTLNKLVGERKKRKHELRGCIGYPYPIKPLVEATIDVAIQAAVSDPRFEPVSLDEMNEIVVEVSILTPPKLLSVSDPMEYPKKIKIGRDGLIVEKGFFKGLLLPQVPVEQKWDEMMFLTWTCYKAGLPGDCWMSEDVKIYTFQAEIFEELEPRGKIVRKEISGESHD
ncbi:MAG: TIGR00296 family protein [Candidatus Asgardarchaeum sp.]